MGTGSGTIKRTGRRAAVRGAGIVQPAL